MTSGSSDAQAEVRRRFISPSMEDIFHLSAQIAKQLYEKGLEFDIIVGISRGGLLPARLLADFMGIYRLAFVRARLYDDKFEKGSQLKIAGPTRRDVTGRRVLLVDDVADSGETLQGVIDRIQDLGAAEVHSAVLYKKPWNRAKVDEWVEETDAWIIFPWERVEVMEKLVLTHGDDAFNFSSLSPSVVRDIKRILRLRKRHGIQG